MTISFVCPQGHPLTAPDDMAGRAGKCPHCGTRFLIPRLEAAAGPAAGGPAGRPRPAGGTIPGGAAPAAGATSPRAEAIIFFCPNGHKLNGPATLRGKLGLCPHCQSRFRIPAEPEDEVAETPPPGELVDEEGEVIEGRPLEENAEGVDDGQAAGEAIDGTSDGDADAAADTADAAAATPWQAAPPESMDSSRWLELTRWLWTQRDPRSAVELRLRNGATLQPNWFSASLSDGRVGVFARQAEDGLYDITAIGWEQIDQIEVRRCEQLPPGLFE